MQFQSKSHSDFKINMEMQRAKNKPRKRLLEKEKDGKTYFSHRTGLTTVTIIKTEVLVQAQTHRPVETNRSSETHSHIGKSLIHERSSSADQWERRLFSINKNPGLPWWRSG